MIQTLKALILVNRDDLSEPRLAITQYYQYTNLTCTFKVLTIILISESAVWLTKTVRNRSPPPVLTVTARVSLKIWPISTTIDGFHSWSCTDGGPWHGRKVRADWWIKPDTVGSVTWHCTMVQLLSLVQGESTAELEFAIILSNPWHTCSNVTLRAKASGVCRKIYVPKTIKIVIIFTVLWFDNHLYWDTYKQLNYSQFPNPVLKVLISLYFKDHKIPMGMHKVLDRHINPL